MPTAKKPAAARAAVPVVPAPAAPSAARRGTRPLAPLDADALWRLARLSGITLAPDGRAAVCSVTRYEMEANRGRSQLWWLPCDEAGGKPRALTVCGDKDGQPAFSPDGRQIAFVARREQQGAKDAAPQLYLVPADGGEARRVSDFGPGVEAFKWLPDSRRIVFSAWVWPRQRGAAAQNREATAWRERKESGYATESGYYRQWDRNLPQDRVLHLLLLDSASGRITDLFEGTAFELPRGAGGNTGFDVHPDGRRIVFAHDPSPDPRQGNRLALAMVELAARRITPLLDDPQWDFDAPCFSPDGRRLAFTAAEVGRHHMALALPALLDLAASARGKGRAWRLLAPRWDRHVDGPLRWRADGAALLFAAEDRGRCPLWRLAVDGDAAAARPEALVPGGWVQGFDVAGDRVVTLADSALFPARAELHALGESAAAARRLDHFNDAELARHALGATQELQLTGARGDAVQMWLTYPPGFDARRKHPLLQIIHGGPFAASGDNWSWRWNAQLLAAQGHVVAQVNYHGSSGFGEAFRTSLCGRQGELETQDLEAATDWLLQQPWADARRVFAAGGSYGGFLVAWMNGHLPAGRYRAYVCHAGVFDRIATFSADSYNSRPRDLQARWWEDMDKVLAQSPHAAAAAMATPTLVIHGALDYRVPDTNGLAYYNTLKARGVPARLLWFPDENHWVLKPRNSRQWYTEFAAWLRRHDLPPARRPARGAKAPAAAPRRGEARR